MLIALLFATLFTAPSAASQQQQPSIEVPYKGLSYSMLSHNGVTIMVAPLNRSILEYSTVQVWISNGSKESIRISPQSFEIREPGGAMLSAVSDDEVMAAIPQRASQKDLLELINTYETVLNGFANEKSIINYTQRSRRASKAGGLDLMSKRSATALASAIILPTQMLKPGESMDGTAFFRASSKSARITYIGAHMAGAIFDFPQAAPMEEHVH